MANKVLADVRSFGVKLSDSITPKKICNVRNILIAKKQTIFRATAIQSARLSITSLTKS